MKLNNKAYLQWNYWSLSLILITYQNYLKRQIKKKLVSRQKFKEIDLIIDIGID